VGIFRIALTGGIATGKSHVLKRFRSYGIPTIDADRIARDVVQVDCPANASIRSRFGESVFQKDGQIDRKKLAARVFDSTSDRKALEDIIHPYVRKDIDQWFDQIELNKQARFAIAAIPLLFETNRQADFDLVLLTACQPDNQLNRLLEREGIDEIAARKRINAQLPSRQKEEGADFIIRTDGSYLETEQQITDVLNALIAKQKE
tara:strand:+ start:15975 stop:16589 length:615 start_codon:yes stop_codon:yes gene_type:complete